MRQDQQAAEQRRQRVAHRVEGLDEVQAGRGALRRPDHRHVGVGRDLQQRHARGQHELGAQEHRKRRDRRRGHEQQRPHRHRRQADDQRGLVADRLDQLGRRQRHDEVGAEEGELDQRRLLVVEREHGLEVRRQHVVEHRTEPPHEEDGGQHRERPGIASLRRRALSGSADVGLDRQASSSRPGTALIIDRAPIAACLQRLGDDISPARVESARGAANGRRRQVRQRCGPANAASSSAGARSAGHGRRRIRRVRSDVQ